MSKPKETVQVKRVLLLLCALLILPSFSSAEEQTLTLSLYDAATKTMLQDGILITSVVGGEEQIAYVEDGVISLPFSGEAAQMEIVFDRIDTDALDYYGSLELTTEEDQDIFLFPVGGFQGVIVDTYGNLLADTELTFECSTNYGQPVPVSSNELGSFKNPAHSPGTCTVFATSEGDTAHTTFAIEQGKLTGVVLHFEETTSYLWVFVLGGLLLVVVFVLVKMKLKRKQKKPVWLDDIRRTLSEKENKVIDHLLQSANYTTTQSTLRHTLGIPNTSLSRVLISLDKKEIITIEAQGKFRKVQLTEWFIEKQKKG